MRSMTARVLSSHCFATVLIGCNQMGVVSTYLFKDKGKENGRAGEAAEHDFGVLLDAMDLSEETEGLVNRHVADEGDEENRAEGGAGLGGIQVANIAQDHGEAGGKARADEQGRRQRRAVTGGKHEQIGRAHV